MITKTSSKQVSNILCMQKPSSICQDCKTNGKLMCRFDKKDMINFLMIFMPFAVTVIVGTIRAGFGWYLLLWLAYSLFFFFVWEAYVLCRHCPYWADKGNVLHCHANYGIIKIWKYQPGPMSNSDKFQFVIGAISLVAFPFPFLLLGHEYLLSIIGACITFSGAFILWKNVCSRCINFSCPANAVPKQLVDTYLRLNPEMKAAWEESGYHLDNL